MLEIAKIRVEPYIFIGHLVAVDVAHDGEVRRIGHPQATILPRESLDAVEARGKPLAALSHAVVIFIQQNPD